MRLSGGLADGCRPDLMIARYARPGETGTITALEPICRWSEAREEPFSPGRVVAPAHGARCRRVKVTPLPHLLLNEKDAHSYRWGDLTVEVGTRRVR